MSTGAPPEERKREIRRRLRERRRSLPAAEVAAAGRALERHADVAGQRTVAGYLATDGELAVAGLLVAAARAGAKVLLPRMRADGGIDLVALPTATAAADLEALAGGAVPTGFLRGRGGIPEPTGPAVDAAGLGLPATIFVPAVAFDRTGQRLGRGGGAYDRALGNLRALGWRAIGVCHAAHVLADLPTEPHDVAVDAILTEEALSAVVPERDGRS